MRVERRFRDVELVIAECRELQTGRVQHVDHLLPASASPLMRAVPSADGERSRRRASRAGALTVELRDHRSNTRETAGLTAFDRADLVNIVEMRDRDDGRLRRLRVDPDAVGGSNDDECQGRKQ